MEPITYEDVAWVVQQFLNAGHPLPPAVHWSWEAAQVIHAIGRWWVWQRWEKHAFDNFWDNPDAELEFWQRQLNEAYIMRDIAEQGRLPWDSIRQHLDTHQQMYDALDDAVAAGHITAEERYKIRIEEYLAGNPRTYCERVIERMNNLNVAPVAPAEAAAAVADIPVMG